MAPSIYNFPPTRTALWVCQDSSLDHNKAFKSTKSNFEARLEVLKASGVFVVSRVFELFKEVSEYIQSTHPEGIDLLGLRIHADEKSLPLSRKPGGSYSLANPEEGRETIENIFSKVRKFVMIEGCKTGFGKNGILKHVVSLCRPGVVGIGSRGSEFEVGFDSVISGYMRFECLRSKQDITRIYYKTENGATQNIPVEELMLLWDLFKEKCTTPEAQQRGFELCYKLLGERNDPSTFLRIRTENEAFIHSVRGSFESIRKQLLEVEVTRSLAKSIWVEMLKGLEAVRSEFGVAQEISEIPVDQVERAMTPDQIVTDRGALRVGVSTSYQKVYRFILGCAFIDKYKPLLMLLDDGTGFGPASQAIRALSGLTIHGDDSLSITAILAHYFPVIKKSYLTARNSYLIKDWFQGVSKGVCFNNVIKFIDEFYEERILPSKEERLRIAVLKGDGAEAQRLIEQGVNFDSPELSDTLLCVQALNNGLFFVAFLFRDKRGLESKDANNFKGHLIIKFKENNPLKLEAFDEELACISRYLAKKNRMQEAIQYANLIGSTNNQVKAKCECAISTANLSDINEAIDIISPYFPQIGNDPPNLDSVTKMILEDTHNQIMEMALKLKDFSAAWKLANLVQNNPVRFYTSAKLVFDSCMRGKSLEEVNLVFQGGRIGSMLFLEKCKELLSEGDINQALRVADAIQHPLESTEARCALVSYFNAQSNPDAAYLHAMKITEERTRDPLLLSTIHNYNRRQLPYAAWDVARSIIDPEVHSEALSVVANAFLKLGHPYLAFRVVQEIEQGSFDKEVCFRMILSFMRDQNRMQEGIFLARQLGPWATGFLQPFAKRYKEENQFEIVLEIGEAIQDATLADEASLKIAENRLAEGNLPEALRYALKIQTTGMRNHILFDIVDSALMRNDPNLACRAARGMSSFNIEALEKVSGYAFHLIAEFLVKENHLSQAFQVACETLNDLVWHYIAKQKLFDKILSQFVENGEVNNAIELALSLPQELSFSEDPLDDDATWFPRREALFAVMRKVALAQGLDVAFSLISELVVSQEERALVLQDIKILA